MNNYPIKAIISEGVMWLWATLFFALQFQRLLAPWLFTSVNSVDIKQCGLGVFIKGLFAGIMAVMVFFTLAKQTLLSRNKNKWADLKQLEQSKRLRHWVLLIAAIPGSLLAMYLVAVAVYPQI